MRFRSAFKNESAGALQSPAEFGLHAERQRALILEAKARQEQAQVRLMNLEVARRALWLLVAVIGVASLLLGLLGETWLSALPLWK